MEHASVRSMTRFAQQPCYVIWNPHKTIDKCTRIGYSYSVRWGLVPAIRQTKAVMLCGDYVRYRSNR